MFDSGSDFFLALIAILFPPIAVWIKRSLCSLDSLLNLLLCVLGYLPGLLHAWYIIAKYPDESSSEYSSSAEGYRIVSDGGEEGRMPRYYVARPPAQGQGQGGQGYGTRDGGQGGYGTRDGMGVGGYQGEQRQAGGPQGQRGEAGSARQGERGDEGVLPSYQEAVSGDHKVQT